MMDNISCNVGNDPTYRYEAVLKIEVNPVRYATSVDHFMAQIMEEYKNDYFYICQEDFSQITSDNPNEED